MERDMISVFNQLTSNELADYNLFKDILDDHFLKFRYFYALINKVDLKKIDSINCETNENYITICIIPYENKYINNIVKAINKERKKNNLSDLFITDMIESSSNIYISIYLSDKDKEGDIYYDY